MSGHLTSGEKSAFYYRPRRKTVDEEKEETRKEEAKLFIHALRP